MTTDQNSQPPLPDADTASKSKEPAVENITGDVLTNVSTSENLLPEDDLHAVVAASFSPEYLASIDLALDQIVASTDLFNVGPIDVAGANDANDV